MLFRSVTTASSYYFDSMDVSVFGIITTNALRLHLEREDSTLPVL